MSETAFEALLSAAASSAMEGLPLDAEKMAVIRKIMNGELTLQAYFASVQQQEREN